MLAKVKIELSRRCPLSNQHPKCPVTKLYEQFQGSLENELVIKTLKFFKDFPEVALLFFMYNEPTADCRLLYFIHYARQHLGITNHLSIASNGWGMDEATMNALISEGLNEITLTAYSQVDYDRFYALKDKFQQKNLKLIVRHTTCLDNRMMNQPVGGVVSLDDFVCHKPKGLLCVSSTGQVSLCEYDWQGTVPFGNLHQDEWVDIMKRREVLLDEIYKEAKIPNICTGCLQGGLNVS